MKCFLTLMHSFLWPAAPALKGGQTSPLTRGGRPERKTSAVSCGYIVSLLPNSGSCAQHFQKPKLKSSQVWSKERCIDGEGAHREDGTLSNALDPSRPPWTRLRVFRGRGNRHAEAIGAQTPNHLHCLALQEAIFLCPHHTRPCGIVQTSHSSACEPCPALLFLWKPQ